MDELAKRFLELSDKYGSHVVDAARASVQVSAWSNIEGNIITFLVGLAILPIAKWAWNKDVRDAFGDIPFSRIGAVILIFISLVCFIVFVTSMFDPWTYVPLFNPDLAIAHKILGV